MRVRLWSAAVSLAVLATGLTVPTSAAAAPPGSSAPLPLERHFDNRGVSDDAHPARADLDGAGNPLSAQDLATAGWDPGRRLNLDGSVLTWPDTRPGEPDNVVADGQRVLVEGTGDALTVLALASSPAGPGAGVDLGEQHLGLHHGRPVERPDAAAGGALQRGRARRPAPVGQHLRRPATAPGPGLGGRAAVGRWRHGPGATGAADFIGINDLRWGTGAQELTEGLRSLVHRADRRELRVVAATLAPCRGFRDCTADVDARRTAVNDWLREAGTVAQGGPFDAVLDFDAVLRDPADPGRILPRYDSGDHLHPGDTGLRALAESVDLRQLVPSGD